MGTFNVSEMQELIRKAIGGRKQADFAEIAGLSPFNLNRLLNQDEPAIPRKSTLKKISDASEGRVTEAQILHACGYETALTADEKEEKTPQEANIAIASAIKEGIEEISGRANKYASIEDMLETVALMKAQKYNIHFQVDEEKKYFGTGKRGAERYANITCKWSCMEYDGVEAFSIYFCKTENGGVIISDCEFVLEALLKLNHPEAEKFLMWLSEQGDVKYTDYPIVFRCTKHQSTDAEKKLLQAIFGEEN